MGLHRALRHPGLCPAARLVGMAVRVVVGEEWLQAPPDPFAGHHPHRLLVGELAVLDAPDARAQGAADPLGGVDMGAHIGAPVGGRLDGGTQLAFGELRHVERVLGGRDAAACHHLDLAGTPHELLAGPPEHGVGTVRDGGDAHLLRMARRVPGSVRELVGEPEIAVPRGLGDHRPGGEDARACHDPLVDRPLEGEGRSTDVAHGGEAALQRGRRFLRRPQMDIADVSAVIAVVCVTPAIVACQWASMSPGITVLPPQSIRSASPGP